MHSDGRLRPEPVPGSCPLRPLGWHLHGGVVVCVQGALGHGGEGLADEQLGEGRLRAPHHCRQDVDGRLRTGRGASARPRVGQGACTPVRTV